MPDGDYLSFLERYTRQHFPAGDLIDRQGRVLGRHRGTPGYTIGQRKGLGLAMGTPVYVCAKDMEKNTVTVGPESALYTQEAAAGDWNWIVSPPQGPIEASVKLRYRQQEQPAVLWREGDTVRMRFSTPQRAVTPGQAAVAYQGDVVLGGGTVLA